MLSKIQEKIIIGTLNFPISELEQLEPMNAIIALKSLLIRGKNEWLTRKDYLKQEFLDTVDAIEQVHKILTHDCPQNRNVGNVITGGIEYGVKDGIVYYHRGEELFSEPQGLLGLTAYQDANTTHPVTKEDVVSFIKDIVEQRISEIIEKSGKKEIIGVIKGKRKNDKDAAEDIIRWICYDDQLLTKPLQDGYTVFHLICEYGTKEMLSLFIKTYAQELCENINNFLENKPTEWKSNLLQQDFLDMQLLEASRTGYYDDEVKCYLILGANVNIQDQKYSDSELYEKGKKDEPCSSTREIVSNSPGSPIGRKKIVPCTPITPKKHVLRPFNKQKKPKQSFVPNSKNPNKYTPLHYAVLRNKIEMAITLIQAGARLGVANAYGKTPLQLETSLEIKEVLEKAQQQSSPTKLLGKRNMFTDTSEQNKRQRIENPDVENQNPNPTSEVKLPQFS